MSDLETIKVKDTNGQEVELKVITILKKPNDDKNFLLYTFDEKKDSVDIYASVIKEEQGSYILDSISYKEDWELVQKAIEELSE